MRRAPRWFKVLMVVLAGLALLVLAALAFGGEHGPQRHTTPSPLEDPHPRDAGAHGPPDARVHAAVARRAGAEA